MFHSRLSENRARRHLQSAWFFNAIRIERSFLDGLANGQIDPLRPFPIIVSGKECATKGRSPRCIDYAETGV
jgi:hypothetical protein